MPSQDKNKEFNGFLVNFQFLREFNPEWDLDVTVVFMHLLFRGHKNKWMVYQSMREAALYLKIRDLYT